ncbi:methylmalonate-semialdehyde dehydrogenase (acylating) [Photobacterium jeanii]|uniref:methylmalonate-semialdehyde dehydrogenase (CoA acylating) n=1 Tax=Photobacterium jeanii TaxID=858640 RepID=A0A178K728_9GAMM|nr:CoA-acylating methylmalonate-semialdehyde dehydrogenase [Photobacterium jeanii]OAN13149.1 methylmalonate-semialdehyde dehydrogenase (acylating) [Photobacterium jeanii]PST89301.1 methylmalonate-semialdehyde dehydrogenase (CoA acylating) [Photobacterium jeanii]
MVQSVPLYIEGEFRQSATQRWVDVTDPASNQVIAKLPCATDSEIEAAIADAKRAFMSWKEVATPERARLMLNYQHLLKQHHDEIAALLSSETGKTTVDAKGDVWRGIEVVEQAANIASLMMGETVENVATDIDSYSLIQPLGVCCGITPFNFPAMIPLWMFPMAIACGNTFVLKPSEQVPLTAMRLAELFEQAGAPKGVLQVVHGQKSQVDQLLAHPDIRTISFVGSVPVAQYIYQTATTHFKRVQAFAGAKNHMVVMPDANKEQVLTNLVSSSVGAAGQRCMAISVAVFVGDSKAWIPELVAEMAKVKPGVWNDETAAYGPLISAAAKSRVIGLIEQGKQQGAICELDGTGYTVAGYEQGNWLAPTVFSGVTPAMELYQQEIFGPVLLCMTVDTLEEAIALVNANPYGNGTSIFTACGAAARKYQHQIQVGQVGINVPIPVPLPFFSFTGWRGSFYGDLHAYGKQAVRFYTETKTVTARWFDDDIPAALNMSIQLK